MDFRQSVQPDGVSLCDLRPGNRRAVFKIQLTVQQDPPLPVPLEFREGQPLFSRLPKPAREMAVGITAVENVQKVPPAMLSTASNS